MNLPTFSADKSLYKTNRHYATCGDTPPLMGGIYPASQRRAPDTIGPFSPPGQFCFLFTVVYPCFVEGEWGTCERPEKVCVKLPSQRLAP